LTTLSSFQKKELAAKATRKAEMKTPYCPNKLSMKFVRFVVTM